MSLVTITISTDNAAFEEHPEYELARVLDELATKIRAGDIDEDGAAIRDINGNECGRIEVEA